MTTQRTAPIPIRLTPAERATLKRAAAVVGWPLGTFVRRAALAVAARHLDPPAIEVGGAFLALTEDDLTGGER